MKNQTTINFAKIDVREVTRRISRREGYVVKISNVNVKLVANSVVYADVEDVDNGQLSIVWPLYDSLPTIKNRKYNKQLVEQVKDMLDPIVNELHEQSMVAIENEAIAGGFRVIKGGLCDEETAI